MERSKPATESPAPSESDLCDNYPDTGGERALALYQAIGDRKGEANVHFRLARGHFRLGEYQNALQRVEQAIDLVEAMRDRVLSRTLRSNFLGKKNLYYQLRVRILMEQAAQGKVESDESAFRASEEARAQNLLDILGSASIDLALGGAPEWVSKERELRKQLGRLDKERGRILSRGEGVDALDLIDARIEAIATDLEVVRERLRTTSPEYASLTQPEAIDLTQLRSEVLDDESLLLEYYLGESQSFLWAVSGETFDSYKLPPRSELEEMAKDLRGLLVSSARTGGRQGFERLATRLGDVLLGQVANLSDYSRILVVADGALQFLPFGLFPVSTVAPQYTPLLESKEVISLPSASVVAVLRQQLEGRPASTGSLAVLADPVFDLQDPRVLVSQGIARKVPSAPSRPPGPTVRFVEDTTGTPLERLLHSRREADAISAIYPPSEVLKAVDFAAKKKLVFSGTLADFRTVHFATHGLLNFRRPDLSGLILSLLDEDGEPINGFLRMHEIYGLDLPVELVVLSACSTALGRDVRGEGLVGLTRGFMYAGAAAVIASLWKVDDRATAHLMTLFHENLAKGHTVPAALQAAQLSMWRDPRWSAPYYWAGFVFQGDWSRGPLVRAVMESPGE